MFGAVDNLIYYSALGNPDSWYLYDYIPVKGDITALATVSAGLLVMGRDWTVLLRGNQPSNFTIVNVSDAIGCTSASSLAYIDTNVIWLSQHGIVMSDGFSIRQLTADRIEDLSGIHPNGAIVVNNVYYLAYRPILTPSDTLYPSDILYPNGSKGTGYVDQGIIVMDFKRGNGYSYKILDYKCRYLSSVNGYPTVTVGDYDSGMQLEYIEFYNDVDFEDLTTMRELTYASPLLIDGSMTTLKEYDKVRVVYKGEFDIQVLFDDDKVVVSEHLEATNLPDFTAAIIGIPNNNDKSYSIRFVVRGRGVINGIQYSYKVREVA
jgi:hypothetical protein